MALQLFTLETLGELDMGKATKAFEHELRRCVQDCIDRPADSNARTVTLQMTLKPVPEGDVCDTVSGEFEIKGKVPARRTRLYSFGVKKTGGLVFNADSPDDVAQQTLLDE